MNPLLIELLKLFAEESILLENAVRADRLVYQWEESRHTARNQDFWASTSRQYATDQETARKKLSENRRKIAELLKELTAASLATV